MKNIIRQNKKAALQEFLFGKDADSKPDNQASNPRIQILEDQIQTLQNQVNSFQDRISDLETTLEEMIITLENQVNSFQDRISDLETTLENSKYALRRALESPDTMKSIQQGDSTLKSEKSLQSANLLSNDSKVRNPTSQRKGMKSKSVSDAPKIDFKPLSSSQQYNVPSNQEKGLQGPNFTTSEDNFVGDVWQSPGKISEEERIEIIQRGFQRQAEGKISLKKYYESTDPYSLYQLKGYNIKYETIRRTKLYQQLKF